MNDKETELQSIFDFSPPHWEQTWNVLLERHPKAHTSFCRALGCADPASAPNLSDLRDAFPGRDLLVHSSQQGFRLEERNDAGVIPLIEETRVCEMETVLADESIYAVPGMISFGLLPARIAKPHTPDELLVFCLEPDVLYLVAELILHDYTEVLSNLNFYLAVGDDFDTHFSDTVNEEALTLSNFREWILILGYALPSDAENRIHAAVDKVTRDSEQALESLNRRMTEIRERPHRTDWGPGTRLWTCGISRGEEMYSIHLEILRTLVEEYRQEGIEVTFRHELPFRQAISCRLRESYAETDPDCVFFLNTFPNGFLEWIFQSTEVEACCPIPRVVWMTDDFAYAPGNDRGFSNRDIVFCVDETYLPRAEGLGAGKAYFLPTAASLPGPGEYRSEYDHPIVFVGSVTDLRSELSNLQPAAKAWLQQSASAVIQHVRPESIRLLDEVNQANAVAVAESICMRMGKQHLTGDQALAYALYVIGNTYKRVWLVRELLPLGIAVYGNADWETLLENEERHAYRGPAPYEEVAHIYASAKICLNIHSLQCPTCLNPRDFDVPMAGGFLLSEWVPDVEKDYLVDEKEAVFYKSTPHLKELANHYLSNDQPRREIATAGRERVLRDHQYRNRAEKSLELLRAR